MNHAQIRPPVMHRNSEQDKILTDKILTTDDKGKNFA